MSKTMFDRIKEPWYSLAEPEANSEVTRLNIFGVIGGGFFCDESVTCSQLCKELAGIKTKNLEITINSPGGSVCDGMAIYNAISALRAQGKSVTVIVSGIAASIASVIALAAEKVKIYSNSFFMIHRAWAFVSGNADELRGEAANLEKMQDEIIRLYKNKSGLTTGKIYAMLKGENGKGTTMNAAETLENGFADEIIEVSKSAQNSITEKWLNFYSETATDSPEEPEKKPENEESGGEKPEPKQPGSKEPEKKPEEDPASAKSEDAPKTDPEKPEEPEKKPENEESGGEKPEPKQPGSKEPEKKPEEDPAELKARIAALEKENEELKARREGENRLAKIAIPHREPIQRTPLNWDDALNICGGDYAKARKKYPEIYLDFMKSNTKGA